MKVDRKHGDESGAVLIEAALTLLVFFVFIFAIWEMGRVVNFEETLTNAAREGARFAVLPLTQTSTMPTDDEIRAHVRTYLRAAGVDDATATIAITRPVVIDTGPVNTDFTTVTVSVPYNLLTISMFSSLQKTLTATASMRNETSRDVSSP